MGLGMGPHCSPDKQLMLIFLFRIQWVTGLQEDSNMLKCAHNQWIGNGTVSFILLTQSFTSTYCI